MNVLWLILGHYILDYPLQSDFLANTKGKYFYSLLAHSMIYGLGISFILNMMGHFSLWKAFVLVISHIVIDYAKSHAKNKDRALTSYLYIDQILHIGINILMLAI